MRIFLKKRFLLAITLSILLQSACQQSPKQPAVVKKSTSKIFNTGLDKDWLLMACMIYVKQTKKQLRWDDGYAFQHINTEFHLKYDKSGGNGIDSLIKSFKSKNNDINFNSPEAAVFLREMVENINTVYDVIFAKVESDADEDELRRIGNKMLTIPDLKKIYRLHVPPGQDMTSMAETDLSLNIQLAYYLQIQTRTDKARIVKE